MATDRVGGAGATVIRPGISDEEGQEGCIRGQAMRSSGIGQASNGEWLKDGRVCKIYLTDDMRWRRM